MVRELRVPAQVVFAALANEELIESMKLPSDARVTDVALDHGHAGTNRGTPPVIVLQISSNEFSPEDAGRPILPMSFTR